MTERDIEAAVVEYLKDGPARFLGIDSALDHFPVRKIDGALQRLRRRGVLRTVRNKARFGDGQPRWELVPSSGTPQSNVGLTGGTDE